jgi:hypothetical protein
MLRGDDASRLLEAMEAMEESNLPRRHLHGEACHLHGEPHCFHQLHDESSDYDEGGVPHHDASQ